MGSLDQTRGRAALQVKKRGEGGLDLEGARQARMAGGRSRPGRKTMGNRGLPVVGKNYQKTNGKGSTKRGALEVALAGAEYVGREPGGRKKRLRIER